MTPSSPPMFGPPASVSPHPSPGETEAGAVPALFPRRGVRTASDRSAGTSRAASAASPLTSSGDPALFPVKNPPGGGFNTFGRFRVLQEGLCATLPHEAL